LRNLIQESSESAGQTLHVLRCQAAHDAAMIASREAAQDPRDVHFLAGRLRRLALDLLSSKSPVDPLTDELRRLTGCELAEIERAVWERWAD